MTDLVLVNPRVVGQESKYPPIGLLSLAAYVREHGFSVAVVDEQIQELTDDQVVEIVHEYNPLLCGVSVHLTFQAAFIRPLMPKLRQAMPTTFFVAGGMHISICPWEAKELGFDYCIVGEGEVSLLRLLTAIKEGRHEEHIITSPLIPDLDSLGLPAWDLISVKSCNVNQPDTRYTMETGVCLSIVTSRGCLYNCSFCCSKGVFGRTHRERGAENVVDELELLYKEYGVSKFFIVDESIFGNKERAEEFADEILRRQLQIQFSANARANDPGICLETLAKLRHAGLVRLDVGVESGSQKILNDIRKGITVEQIIRAHNLAHELGIKTTSLMISGHLEETWEDVYDSFELLARLRTDYSEFAALTPYPGTQDYEKARREGWLRSNDWSQYFISNPWRIMRTRHFDYDEIQMLTQICNDVVQFIIRWQKSPPRTREDFYKIIRGPEAAGLTWEGRYWLSMYMLTKNRSWLRKLDLDQVKHQAHRRRVRKRLFDNRENVTLLSGIKRNPFIFFKKPQKLRVLKLVILVSLERMRDFDLYTTRIYAAFCTFRLLHAASTK